MTQLNEILAWYGSLSPETLAQLPAYYQAQARFKDPFNDVIGPAAIAKIFEHMFATTDNPRFVIENTIEQGQQAFVTWVFHFHLNGQAYSIVGGSHFVFGDDGLVTLHRDYWDAAEELLQKLPVVGAPIRWLRGKFKVPQT
ncbi:nuclear transport factor 2 family protein [Chitinibacter bivalviorum]|uniref:Nuclear transport factor 2 family protein n=1 Tax=Chitinibacter bivalviorum TaxID=2739434 RepID=A0A7H9BGX1_9NEIS|nr:nuclear transport factor 2 family protein [Chitinibacter bivalviorum]QLG87506.1 nuclear transport factor 2 family protein [Chitinibacter bivalviorum]